MMLISLLNVSARPATLEGVSKIQVEVREVYRLGCMRVVRIQTWLYESRANTDRDIEQEEFNAFLKT